MKKKKSRFVILLSSLLLLGFVITCFVSYYVARDSLSSQIAETALPLTSDNVYSEIQRDLLRPIFISSLMAHDTFVRDWAISGEQDEEAIVRYLSEIQRKYGAVTSFFISERTRKYYHPNGVLKVVNENDQLDKWYFRVQKIPNEYEINVDPDTADRQSMTIFINYKVFDYSQRYIGATGIGLAVEAVKELIKTYQNRYGRRIYFIDRQGNITLRSSDKVFPDNIRMMPALSQYATQILTAPGNSLQYKENGKTIYFNSRYVPEFGWYLIVEQEEISAQNRILMTLLMNLGISIVVTAIVLFVVNLTIGKYQNKLEEMATTDKLTGLANRYVFEMLFEQAAKYSKRRGASLSTIMFDLDRFKQINDTYGHPAGDLVLKTVSRIAKGQIRDSDVLFRWGGEEFFIILPDCHQDQAVSVAEKIRLAIEQHPKITVDNHEINMTASFGVAQFLEDESEASLIKRVDSALYNAKKKGRNRVELAS